MTPRTILHTGKGGAGTSTIAAASAVRLAAAGHRTLLLGIGPGACPSEPLGVDAGPQPVRAGERLDVIAPSVESELEQAGGSPADLLAMLDGLPAAPGLDELAGLLALRRAHAEERWTAIVVDLGPVAVALRTLALAQLARGVLARRVPQRSRRSADRVPAWLASRALRALLDVDDILRDDEATTARVVLDPGRASLAQARRAWTGLALRGVLADAAILARLPPGRPEPLERAAALLAPAPVLVAPLLAGEPVGVSALDALGARLLAGRDPAAVLREHRVEELEVGAGGATLRLATPLASRERILVRREGDRLLVAVDGERRAIDLPPALAGYRAAGAELRDGVLHVTFDPPARTADG